MQRIKTLADFKALIEQTLDDLDELDASIEYDEEFMGCARELVAPLKHHLTELLQRIATGQYHPDEKDLPFMPTVLQADTNVLPFKQAFMLLNSAHKRGFQD